MSTNFFTAIGQFMDNVVTIAAQQTATVAPLPARQQSASAIAAVPSATTPDGVCQLCRKDDKSETLLICDGCETMLHTRCLNLPAVPPGDWFCPRCVSEGKTATVQSPTEDDVVVVYERVSSKGQDAPEYGREGLKTQRHTIMEFCMKRGIRIRHTFTDVGSARNLVREEPKRGQSRCTLPEYGQMLAYAHKCKDPIVILVYSVSRFGRNLEQVTEFLHELHEMGCYVFSVSDNVSSSDANFLTLVAQSQAQSDDLSRVMRASIERRRQQGHFIGRAPFGYEAYVDAGNIRRIRPVVAMAEALAIINNVTITTSDAVQQLTAAGAAFAEDDLYWDVGRVSRIRKRLDKLGLTSKRKITTEQQQKVTHLKDLLRNRQQKVARPEHTTHHSRTDMTRRQIHRTFGYDATSSTDPVSEVVQEMMLRSQRSPKTPSPIDQSTIIRQLRFDDDEEKDLRCQQPLDSDGGLLICSEPVVDKELMLCITCKEMKMNVDRNKVNDDED